MSFGGVSLQGTGKGGVVFVCILSFKTALQLASAKISDCPFKMEIGCVYLSAASTPRLFLDDQVAFNLSHGSFLVQRSSLWRYGNDE